MSEFCPKFLKLHGFRYETEQLRFLRKSEQAKCALKANMLHPRSVSFKVNKSKPVNSLPVLYIYGFLVSNLSPLDLYEGFISQEKNLNSYQNIQKRKNTNIFDIFMIACNKIGRLNIKYIPSEVLEIEYESCLVTSAFRY